MYYKNSGFPLIEKDLSFLGSVLKNKNFQGMTTIREVVLNLKLIKVLLNSKL
jgi:hypothetical protein